MDPHRPHIVDVDDGKPISDDVDSQALLMAALCYLADVVGGEIRFSRLAYEAMRSRRRGMALDVGEAGSDVVVRWRKL